MDQVMSYCDWGKSNKQLGKLKQQDISRKLVKMLIPPPPPIFAAEHVVPFWEVLLGTGQKSRGVREEVPTAISKHRTQTPQPGTTQVKMLCSCYFYPFFFVDFLLKWSSPFFVVLWFLVVVIDIIVWCVTFCRERHGNVGGSWRHIREVLGYGGSQLVFVDGRPRLLQSLFI